MTVTSDDMTSNIGVKASILSSVVGADDRCCMTLLTVSCVFTSSKSNNAETDNSPSPNLDQLSSRCCWSEANRSRADDVQSLLLVLAVLVVMVPFTLPVLALVTLHASSISARGAEDNDDTNVLTTCNAASPSLSASDCDSTVDEMISIIVS